MTYASDLAALVDAYAEAKELEAAASDRVKDLRDALLVAHAENVQAYPHGEPEQLVGTRHVITVSTSSGWRLDSTKLKAEHPEVYAAYAKQTSSTRLTVVPR
jgi:hypothetical protein